MILVFQNVGIYALLKAIWKQAEHIQCGRIKMPGLEEDKTVWRYRIRDPADFEKFRVKELGKGVKITVGKIKNSQRWEIQNYMFEKETFKTREQVRSWIEGHLKGAIHTLLDFKAFDEYRRQALNAYMKISEVS